MVTDLLTLDNLGVEVMEDYFGSINYSLASGHNCSSKLRIFFRYAHDNGTTDKDNSLITFHQKWRNGITIPI